jgi:Icc-related predicted phosphoesterase
MSHDKARIWFFTDVHGANECFRKFLNSVKNENKPNILIIGGDITGKQVIPLVEDDVGRLSATVEGGKVQFPATELPRVKKRLSDVGYYPYECSETTYKRFITDPINHREVIDRLVKERVEDWVKLADALLPSRDECQVFINPGNDDPFFIDPILDASWKLIRPEGQIYDLPCGLKMLSTGYSNWTPWDCPRQCKNRDDETELLTRIAEMTSQLAARDFKHVLFNFHCPPRDTTLDLANKIDPNTKQKVAGLRGAAKEHVGSTAVRQAIEVWQPLAGLHGHIHEVTTKRDKIGNTICFNPGTDYYTGHLQGVYLQINKRGEIEAYFLTEERHPRAKKNKPRSLLDALLSGFPVVGPAILAHQTRTIDEKILEQISEMKEDIKEMKERTIPAAADSNADSIKSTEEKM